MPSPPPQAGWKVCSRVCTLQGNSADLRTALPSLTELDLSDNLVASWQFVAQLVAALPELHTLNLSGNRLALPGLEEGHASPAGSGGAGVPAGLAPPAEASLASLRCLVLNGCGVGWPQAVAVGRQLPNLRELHLCGNGISSLALPVAALQGAPEGAACAQAAGAAGAAGSEQGASPGPASSPAAALLAAAFPQLQLLDLDENELSSWAELATLGALPALRSLLLSGNRLAAVEYTGGEGHKAKASCAGAGQRD